MATRTDDQRSQVDLREEKAPPPSPPRDDRKDDRKTEATEAANATTVIEKDEPRIRPARMVFDTFRFLMAGALIAVLAMFAAANDQSVEIDYLVDSQSVALVWPLAGMAAGGAFLMLLLRRRRR